MKPNRVAFQNDEHRELYEQLLQGIQNPSEVTQLLAFSESALICNLREQGKTWEEIMVDRIQNRDKEGA